jgi:hypothetical protein
MVVFQPMHLMTDPALSGASSLPQFLMCSNSDMGASQLMGFCELGLGLFLANQLPRSNCGRGLAPDGGVSVHASGD